MMERLHEEEARRREAESRDRDTSEALRLLREQNANEGQRLRTEARHSARATTRRLRPGCLRGSAAVVCSCTASCRTTARGLPPHTG